MKRLLSAIIVTERYTSDGNVHVEHDDRSNADHSESRSSNDGSESDDDPVENQQQVGGDKHDF